MHLRFGLRCLIGLTSREDELLRGCRGDVRLEFRLRCTRRRVEVLCCVAMCIRRGSRDSDVLGTSRFRFRS